MNTNIANKAKAISSKAMGVVSGLATAAISTVSAFADFNINTSYTVNSGVADINPEGLIIGLCVWICRLTGLAMLIWGIYGYVTARKDGEAEAMNGAIGKLISGVVLLAMPSVLKALGII